MRNFFAKFFKDLKRGENIDLVITFLLAVVAVFLNTIGYENTGLISSITLAVLGLICISLLGTRYKIEEISRATP